MPVHVRHAWKRLGSIAAGCVLVSSVAIVPAETAAASGEIALVSADDVDQIVMEVKKNPRDYSGIYFDVSHNGYVLTVPEKRADLARAEALVRGLSHRGNSGTSLLGLTVETRKRSHADLEAIRDHVQPPLWIVTPMFI
ncbi:MAG: hypothetical protein ACJ72N_04795 [Labedaea sp.]